jgi:hypothetical protein
MTRTVENLRRELEDAFRNRAHLYRLMLDELAHEMGEEKAQALLARILEQRGREVAANLFAGLPPDPIAIGERFLSVSPDEGCMYPHEKHIADGALSIRVKRCPLQDAWRESGLGPDRIATLCRIAGAFDKGLFEAAGLGFTNETWSQARGEGCCWITLHKPGPA